MTVIAAAQPFDAANLIAGFGRHVLRVWQDPGFQAVLRRGDGRLSVNVAKEASAASLRVHG